MTDGYYTTLEVRGRDDSPLHPCALDALWAARTLQAVVRLTVTGCRPVDVGPGDTVEEVERRARQ